MNNETTPALASHRISVCRVGERVLLACDGSAIRHLESRLGSPTRELHISAADRQFLLCQYPDPLPNDVEPAFLSLEQFATACGLPDAGVSALLRSLFNFAGRMLRLESDPVLIEIWRLHVEKPGLPVARIGLETIRYFDTAIATIPSRAGFRDKDVLVGLSGGRLTIGTVGEISRFLSRDNPRQRLTDITFSEPPEGDVFLLIGADGLVRIDARLREQADPETYLAEFGRKEPDFVDLMLRSDEEAATAIARLQRQNRLPNLIDEPLLGLRIVLEMSVSLQHGLFLSGWFHDPEARMSEVVAICHGLEETSLLENWICFDARADIRGSILPVRRFVAFLPGNPTESVTIGLRLENGEAHLISGLPAPSDALGQRSLILDAMAGHACSIEMLERVCIPALGPLQDELNARQKIRRVLELGERSERRISLIIPLYKQTGFLRSQMMAFSIDPYLRQNAEIVYVLDDPTADTSVATMLEGFQYSFPLDVKLVVLDRNGGYAMANNTGVSQAEGELLVLMNSDVIPSANGWLEASVEKLTDLPPFSVIGPKLLYADDSLQHAGMYFHKLSTGYWQNFHYWKGYGRHFSPADQARVVPAVTGACMVLRKADYLEVGGFTTDYVIGDYEDSDLCLKLRERQGRPYYLPSAELYHFERQSMPDSDVDFGSTIYNRALHSHRWSAQIVELMSAEEAQPGLPPGSKRF